MTRRCDANSEYPYFPLCADDWLRLGAHGQISATPRPRYHQNDSPLESIKTLLQSPARTGQLALPGILDSYCGRVVVPAAPEEQVGPDHAGQLRLEFDVNAHDRLSEIKPGPRASEKATIQRERFENDKVA